MKAPAAVVAVPWPMMVIFPDEDVDVDVIGYRFEPVITMTRLLAVTALMAACESQYGDAAVPAPPLQPAAFLT